MWRDQNFHVESPYNFHDEAKSFEVLKKSRRQLKDALCEGKFGQSVRFGPKNYRDDHGAKW